MRLVPQELMERIDPWHRPYNLENGLNLFKAGKSIFGLAFWIWMSEGPDIPFFLWLEGYYICTGVFRTPLMARLVQRTNLGGQRMIEEFRSPGQQTVHYETAQRKVNAWQDATLFQGRVYNGPLLTEVHLIRPRENALRITILRPSGEMEYRDMDTSGTPGKLLDAWAYVRSREGLIFSAPHVEGGMHHSSFVSGKKVMCAGMIKVRNGQMTYIDNDSGHYRPPRRNLIAFVRYLHPLGVFSADATVDDRGTSSGPVPLNDFLAAAATV